MRLEIFALPKKPQTIKENKTKIKIYPIKLPNKIVSIIIAWQHQHFNLVEFTDKSGKENEVLFFPKF